MILIPPAPPPPLANEQEHVRIEKEARRSLHRVFEPIPHAAAYAGGLLLIILLLSPFWVATVMEHFQQKPVYAVDNPSSSPAVLTNVPTGGRDLTLFGGVRLDARREELERPFGLTLLNTRGMRPEIYEGRNAGDVALLVANCYDGLLKEVTLVMRERPVAVEAIEQELIEQFGEPQTRTEETGGPGHLGLNGLHLNGSKDDLADKFASFQHRRALLWTDGSVRVDALIYFNDNVLAPRTTMLQVHLAATAWLQANQTALRPVGLRP